jgi:hypothetical protein
MVRQTLVVLVLLLESLFALAVVLLAVVVAKGY